MNGLSNGNQPIQRNQPSQPSQPSQSNEKMKWEDQVYQGIVSGNNEKPKEILSKGFLDLNDSFSDSSPAKGLSYLNLSIASKNTEMIQFFIYNRARLNRLEKGTISSEQGEGYQIGEKFLIAKSLPFLFKEGSSVLYTPTFLAIECNEREFLNAPALSLNINKGLFLETKEGTDRKIYHFSPLIAAIFHKDENAALNLIDKGAPPYHGVTSIKSQRKEVLIRCKITPLALASQYGLDRVVEALLKKGIEPITGALPNKNQALHAFKGIFRSIIRIKNKSIVFDGDLRDAIQTTIAGEGTLKTIEKWYPYIPKEKIADQYFLEAKKSNKQDLVDEFLNLDKEVKNFLLHGLSIPEPLPRTMSELDPFKDPSGLTFKAPSGVEPFKDPSGVEPFKDPSGVEPFKDPSGLTFKDPIEEILQSDLLNPVSDLFEEKQAIPKQEEVVLPLPQRVPFAEQTNEYDFDILDLTPEEKVFMEPFPLLVPTPQNPSVPRIEKPIEGVSSQRTHPDDELAHHPSPKKGNPGISGNKKRTYDTMKANAGTGKSKKKTEPQKQRGRQKPKLGGLE
jgi:hypothetical protein